MDSIFTAGRYGSDVNLHCCGRSLSLLAFVLLTRIKMNCRAGIEDTSIRGKLSHAHDLIMVFFSVLVLTIRIAGSLHAPGCAMPSHANCG